MLDKTVCRKCTIETELRWHKSEDFPFESPNQFWGLPQENLWYNGVVDCCALDDPKTPHRMYCAMRSIHMPPPDGCPYKELHQKK